MFIVEKILKKEDEILEFKLISIESFLDAIQYLDNIENRCENNIIFRIKTKLIVNLNNSIATFIIR